MIPLMARVAGTITFDRAGLAPRSVQILKRELSFANPDYVKRRAFGRYTGNVAPKICMMRTHKDGNHETIEIPRGAADILKSIASLERDAVIDWVDDRIVHDPIDIVPNIELRDYQAEAVDRMVTAKQGHIVFPCGAGKTVTGIAAIAAIGQPTLVVVHTRDLMTQWWGQVHAILGIKPGQWGGGRKDIQHVTIATVQTLQRMEPEAFDDFVRHFGCVMVDECHHVPASTFQDVISQVPAMYRFGLTATPTREDGLTPLLWLTMGENLYERNYAQLIDAGHLMEPTIEPVHTLFRFAYEGPDDYGAMVEALVIDDVRNAQIAALASDEAAAGETVLVLSDRVDHCHRLADMTGGVALTGEMKAGDRDDVLTRFKLGEIKIVCATSLADEGLDIKRLSRLILAYPGKAAGRTIQRIGRVMRKHPGKSKPKVYDFVDEKQPVLLAQSRKRARIYRRLLGERTLI